MEFIDGIKPNDLPALAAAGLDPKIIAQRGAKFVLRQIFDFGFFHTDPHPGNLFVLPDNVLAPLDFGQVARLTAVDRRLLGEDGDVRHRPWTPPRLISAFRRAGMLDERTDTAGLLRDLDELLDQYHNLPLREIPFGRDDARRPSS